jgi:hypothetical protein
MIWFYEFKGGAFCLFPTIDKDVDWAQQGNRLMRSWRIENCGSVNHKVAEA